MKDKKTNKKKVKPFTFYASFELIDKINKYAELYETSASDFVRHTLIEKIKQLEQQK